MGSILAAGIALRVLAARGDLWLDEVWSILLIKIYARDLWGVFTIHHDNNHLLNSLYLYLVGDTEKLFYYRLLSLAAGAGSLFLMAGVAVRRSRAQALLAVLLAAFSFPLILYSSEARGFAPAVFFALAAFLVLEGYLERPGPGRLVAFWALAAAGILSQYTFLFFYGAVFLWTGLRVLRRCGLEVRSFLLIHVPCLAFFSFLYFWDVRNMVVGGGPTKTALETMAKAWALMAGAPLSSLGTVAGVLVASALLAAGVVGRARAGDDRWVFHLSVVLVVPVLVLVLFLPERMYFRYFLMGYPFFYLLVAGLLADFFRASARGRVLAVGIVILFLAGNLYTSGGFLKLGRGQYRKALNYMAQNTPGKELVIGGDDDYSMQKMLLFYSRFVEGWDVFYAPARNLDKAPPRWFVMSDQGPGHKPDLYHKLPGGSLYRLEKAYPYSGFSGFNWFVYRRVN